jgi:hypothetical protein
MYFQYKNLFFNFFLPKTFRKYLSQLDKSIHDLKKIKNKSSQNSKPTQNKKISKFRYVF